MDWIHSLPTDPFRGASRRLELGPDWWFAIVPESDDAGAAVTCLYRIFPARRAVDASLLATLKRPIV
jgi:hypothetical protein